MLSRARCVAALEASYRCRLQQLFVGREISAVTSPPFAMLFVDLREWTLDVVSQLRALVYSGGPAE